jgi:hypothetical protein
LIPSYSQRSIIWKKFDECVAPEAFPLLKAKIILDYSSSPEDPELPNWNYG